MSLSFLFLCLLSALSGTAAVPVSMNVHKADLQKLVRSESLSEQPTHAELEMNTDLLVGLKLKYMGLLETSANHPDITPEELSNLEQKFGGFVKGVVRHTRSHIHQAKGSGIVHQGGDRFTGVHNYQGAYAEYLNKLFESQAPIQQVAEVGILMGSGIAMWLDLFPDNKVYGFDIDPSNFEKNRNNLKKLGMNDANLKIVTMDQTVDNSQMLVDQVGGQFTFVVDDGCHTEFCARLTIKSFLPRMTDKFLYIIEDSAGLGLVGEIKGMASGVNAEVRGALTIVSRGL